MPFCHECGAEVDGRAKFCPECGAKIFVKIPFKKPPVSGTAVALPRMEKCPEIPSAGKTKGKRKILPYMVLSILILTMVVTAAVASMEGQNLPMTSSVTSSTTTITSTYPSTTTMTTTSTHLLDNRVGGIIPYDGGYPTVAWITYVTKDGTTTSMEAYSGLVVILAEKGTTAAVVSAEVGSLGGELVLEVPICGYYWARVAAGKEADFISRLRGKSWVADAFPCVPIDLAQGGTVYVDAEQTSGWFWDAYDSNALDSNQVIIDAWSNDGYTTHGTDVSQISSSCTSSATASKSEVDIYYQPNGTGQGYINSGSIIPAIALAMINANDADRVTAINLSIGYKDGFNDGVDRHGLDNPDVATIQEGEYQFLAEILHGMETMGQPYLDHVLISIAAGNMGVDLTKKLQLLQELYPNAWGHVIIAGGLDADGNRIRTFNDSDNPDDIIYAKMPGGLWGTSFTAPQLTCLATALAAARPDLSSWQIKKAILEAALPSFEGYRVMPSLAETMKKAEELFPEGEPLPDMMGTWSGSYTANGTNPRTPWAYNDAGELTWTITSASDYYFSGTIHITGIQLRWDQSGEIYGYTSATGSISGSVYGSVVEGDYYYYVQETSSTSHWHFTATLSRGTLTCNQSDSKTSLSFTLTRQ
ncbi:MAG: zinc-ribbon domain-containing protein [Candidatus Hadarchaeum sp.]|uniref:zinc-ribbon domain-containing protein n=1 Tax=Candidatus Hadarchaeum sp. TaxID=2883567 RepID=UPI00317C2367